MEFVSVPAMIWLLCFLAGSIGDVLYGASLLPNLVSLDVSDNAFTGTLPTGLAMPNIKSLILHDNYIQVALFKPLACFGPAPHRPLVIFFLHGHLHAYPHHGCPLLQAASLLPG